MKDRFGICELWGQETVRRAHRSGRPVATQRVTVDTTSKSQRSLDGHWA